MKKVKSYLLIFGFLLLAPLFSGYQDKDFELSKNLDIYHTLMRELNLFYVDEIQPATLIKSSIDNMLGGLDPYTVYIPESQMEDLELMTTGEYGGVGALIRQRDNEVVIADPYEGFPAQKTGLRAGDIIRKIDGKSVSNISSSQISEMMKGQVGTSIKMEVYRPHVDQEVSVNLVREKVRIDNVPHYQLLEDKTGYIRLGGFTQGAAKEVELAFNELKNQGMSGLILDLRSNPGGLLIEAVEIMNLFVNQNEEIVSTRGKVKQWNHTYYTRKPATDTLMPVAVLINSQSASAAEIVAGAMQDLDRGVVIGQRSFGKGLVQTTRDLSYNAKLKITTAKYYIPSGRCIQTLDYSNRRPDGSVGKVADSLATVFNTRNGRPVKDGGGIVPDLTIDPQTLSRLSTSLIYQEKIFDFATWFRNTNETVADPNQFVLTDKDLREFVVQLKDSGFTYQTGSEQKLKELKDMVVRERYNELVDPQLDELQRLLGSDLDKDVSTFEQEVRTLLSEEIVSRYYYQKGRISFMLRSDPVIKMAGDILLESEKYKKVLAKAD